MFCLFYLLRTTTHPNPNPLLPIKPQETEKQQEQFKYISVPDIKRQELGLINSSIPLTFNSTWQQQPHPAVPTAMLSSGYGSQHNLAFTACIYLDCKPAANIMTG